MKKKISMLIVGLVLLFSVNSLAGTCYGCSWIEAGAVGTWEEGSCFEGGSSCGYWCLYCDDEQ